MSKKKIAPIIIGCALCAYYVSIFLMFAFIPNISKVYAIVFAVILILLIGTVLAVVKERIDEIDGGEEDDLSKY